MSEIDQHLGGLFLEFSRRRLHLLSTRIDDCLRRLSEEQVWSSGSNAQNPVGTLVLHLCGNVSQWIASGIGGAPDTRNRKLEFVVRSKHTRSELQLKLVDTVAEALILLDKVSPNDLKKRIRVQEQELTLLEVVYTVIEHFAQHTGQIIFATKALTGKDLGYYQHLD